MTFTASVEGCEEDFECQFFGWAQFMCEIIRGWNEELGKLYEKKYRFLWDRNTSFFIPIMFMASKSKELDGEMAKILDVHPSIIYGCYLETLTKEEQKIMFPKYSKYLFDSKTALKNVIFDISNKNNINTAVNKIKHNYKIMTA